jgi:hypothetical protein
MKLGSPWSVSTIAGIVETALGGGVTPGPSRQCAFWFAHLMLMCAPSASGCKTQLRPWSSTQLTVRRPAPDGNLRRQTAPVRRRPG